MLTPAARPDTAAGFRQPPMLNVAFDELPRCGPENMLTRDIGPRYAQRHHVLQLISEAVGAARLIKSRACPHPARKGLVRKPPVQQNIQRTVGCLDLNDPECLVPLPSHGGKDRIEIGFSVLRNERLRVRRRRRLAEKEDDFRRARDAYRQLRLQGATRIVPRTDAIGQARPTP